MAQYDLFVKPVFNCNKTRVGWKIGGFSDGHVIEEKDAAAITKHLTKIIREYQRKGHTVTITSFGSDNHNDHTVKYTPKGYEVVYTRPTKKKTEGDKTSTGKTSTGKTSTGKTSTGKTSTGKTSTGKTSTGKTSTGKTSTPKPETADGEKPKKTAYQRFAAKYRKEHPGASKDEVNGAWAKVKGGESPSKPKTAGTGSKKTNGTGGKKTTSDRVKQLMAQGYDKATAERTAKAEGHK